MRVTPDCDSINSVIISNAPNIQYNPDIAFGAGYYMVVWSDSRASAYYQIYGARVTPGGSVIETGGIQVGPTNALFQYYPSVAYGGTRFLAIWTYGTSPYQIMGRFINTNGTLGDTVLIAVPGGYTYGTRLVFDGTNYFVAWVEYTGSEYAAKGLRLNSNGIPIGTPFTIASNIFYYNSLGLAFDGYNYLITYSILSGSANQIYGQFYSTSGTPVGSAFKISNSSYNCYYCDLIPGANGRYLNVWSETRTTYDLYGNIDVQVDVDENQAGQSRNMMLKSTIISDAIELIDGAGVNGEVYDAFGRFVGKMHDGYYDCSRLGAGIYFVKTSNGNCSKVVKVRQK